MLNAIEERGTGIDVGKREIAVTVMIGPARACRPCCPRHALARGRDIDCPIPVWPNNRTIPSWHGKQLATASSATYIQPS